MYQPTNYPEQNTLPQDSTYVKPNVQQNNTYMPYQQQCVPYTQYELQQHDPYSQISPSTPPNYIMEQKAQAAYIRCLESDYKNGADIKKYEEKLRIKEQYEERKRSNFHEVLLTTDGEIIETNQLNLPKRIICNLQFPCLCKLQHNGFPSEEIYLILGNVEQRQISIYLKANKLGNSNYIYKKFIANGITFYTDKKAFKINHVEGIMNQLLKNPIDTKIVYDTSGWHLTDSNQFIFIPKEAPTWTELLQKAQ